MTCSLISFQLKSELNPFHPWRKFLRKKRILRTRFSMSVKRVNAGRFDAFRIRYAKHRQTVSSSLRFASSFFRAVKRVFFCNKDLK